MIKNYTLTKSRRLRSTPFSSRIEKQGVKSYTVYNHMLLPTCFTSSEEEYNHLKKHVQIWDVSVQREIEISGKDASELVQLMTCRDLSKSKVGSCYYAPLVDKDGGVVNDPLIYKINESKWRVCIADSDVVLFARGISSVKNFKVKIVEADISVLAVQGPKSFDLMEKIFGNSIKKLPFFKFDYFKFNNNQFLISRSGFSKQGGFEIHIEDIKAGLELYDHFFDIGKEYNLRPGNPNHPERIEAGLLSYGNDIDIKDNPFECGFDKYIDLNTEVFFLSKEKLKIIKAEGIKKKLMGVKMDANSLNISEGIPLFNLEDKLIGELRSSAYSPKFNKVVGIAMVKKEFCKISQKIKISLNGRSIFGEICNLPIL